MPRLEYERINWENAPSTETPINAENLNIMDNAIAALFTYLGELEERIDNLSQQDATAMTATFGEPGEEGVDEAPLQPSGSSIGNIVTGIHSRIRDLQTLKTVAAAKQDKLTWDNEPTSGSQNPVTSNGIYEALANIPIQSATEIVDIKDQVTLTAGTNCGQVTLQEAYRSGNIAYLKFLVAPSTSIAVGGNLDITLSGITPVSTADNRIGYGLIGTNWWTCWLTSATNIRVRSMASTAWTTADPIISVMFLIE